LLDGAFVSDESIIGVLTEAQRLSFLEEFEPEVIVILQSKSFTVA
jgi:hypothetical protein